MRDGRLVDAVADQCVVHVGDRHQPGRNRDVVPSQSLRVARPVPFLLMAVRDLLGKLEEIDLDTQASLGLFDRIAAQLAMGLHDLELFGVEPPGLQQDAVRNADLADVMQRRRLAQQIDRLLGQEPGEARMIAQLAGQPAHVELGAQDMVSRRVVARLGQRSHRQDGHVLDRGKPAPAALHLGLQVLVLVAQEVGRQLHLQMRGHPREEDRWIDRLGDEVRRAQLQADPLFLVAGQRRQEDDGNVARGGIVLQQPADVMAGHSRHHDVEQDQVRRCVSAHPRQCLFTTAGDADRVGILEQPRHQGQIVWRVVHHQDGTLLGKIQWA